MAVDRSNRPLTALSGASTSRVLNLAAIALAQADNPEHAKAPFFESPILNAAILLKHRVRSDESYMFAGTRSVATKIIVPFSIHDLKSGGRSLFVQQRGYHDSLRELGNYTSKSMERDLQLLATVDALPSLDPFLLREHMRGHGMDCADCYFAISQSDRQQMHAYVQMEIRKLTQLASGDGGFASAARMAGALLSSEIGERLEPLRKTLMLEPDDFREGVFSWRGFLYYKWNMERTWPDIIGVLKAIRSMQPSGAMDGETRSFLRDSQQKIVERVRDAGLKVQKILKVYDAAYDDLVRNGTPKTFRDFLLSAPHLFVDLGEKMGVISHIVSFWRYRFPEGKSMTVDAEELSAIFRDFNSSFAANSDSVFA
ncbi:MAG: hypothetical protein JSR60_14320 [Proteobacteria bacterium]|nr:hypothetical protein [Pseudomonadota bacterium]